MSPKKKPPPMHQLLMFTAPKRPPRKERESRGGRREGIPATAGEEAETQRHREAIKEYKERCQGREPWVCAEALLYLSDGDKIVERYALWLFPSDTERYLVSTSGTVEEFYVLVRFEGKGSLSKVSLGVCKTAPNAFGLATATQNAPLEVDPTEGQVIRIISIERDGEPLHHPEDASPFLQNARHIREVIRKHAGKCDRLSSLETLHGHFKVLRTRAYLDAKMAVQADDCGPEEWERAVAVLEDPAVYPWRLANRVAELGAMDALAKAEAEVAHGGSVHVVDDIWLVDEQLPLESLEFVVAGRWAVQKSIKGTGSIPRAKMWEPVVMLNHGERQEFRLMRMA